ncbi:phosphoribosylglycinamide synthetase [Sphingomonas sp. CGMCC 1.13654]|uniref:Phosphoribosylglycinamide synthetase n=1 Tax=Sphingomonas chungangi TaxID=2683589 RepID=A0A838L6N1_9SPHN|nr:phosphoribosylglycinamide synthetase [Sphingomonas chungangi]MBA2934139.1 phosphoribosylglycinamide synthetase [Sphingomonas chungangi]MVW57180.1 phosphoribosylglycinamide synthetase [Sphingomonas chungangi]
MQEPSARGEINLATAIEPLAVPEAVKERMRLLYVAKHARSGGRADAEDGTHAVYHAEIREVLEDIGFNLQIADDYRVLFERPDVDFVFPLLNRAGFLNSEMMLPLLCNRLGIPYLGGSPIIRGTSDDKHLTKLLARSRGIPTADWAVYRRGNAADPARCPKAERYVIKPNASSASWGVRSADDWAGVREAVEAIHAEGHDAIVEPFITGHDIEVSIITMHGRPLILPTMLVEQHDPIELRSYTEKRDLDGGVKTYAIKPFHDAARIREIEAAALNLMEEFAPFDYGRFECRLDVATGRFQFLEVNLNCNLWSRKTISMAARLAGWTHEQLIETILCESLARHGLIDRFARRAPSYRPAQHQPVAAAL